MADSDQDLQNEITRLRGQLAQYKSWFRAVDEHAKFDFWFKDIDSNYAYVNPHFAKNMGRDKCHLQETPIDEIFKNAKYKRVRALDLQVMSEGYLNRVVPCDASGKLEMHEEHRFVVKGEDGKPVGLGCFAFEVTEKSLAEETLHQAEKIAKLCSWRWSAETNALISCSDQMAEFLGVSITEVFELFPKRFDLLVVPEDRHLLKPIDSCVKGGASECYDVEYRMRRPDGKLIHVREKAEPFSTGNSAAEYLGVMQDITEQKATELALKIANGSLEHKVLRRTSELQAAKDVAVKSNEAKSRFLANMSHEVRTPLNGVLGMNQLLERTNLNDTQRYYVDVMAKSGQNLLDVINSVLDMSRIEGGNFPNQKIEFTLSDMIDEIIDIMTPLADAKGLDLRLDYNKDLPTQFIGDRHKIRNIIINLMSNAIKFTEKGFVSLSVSGEIHDDNVQLNVSVLDSGVGISKDDAARVFAQFEQASIGYRREYDGMGLGLSIAKDLAEMMNGTIKLRSKLDVGSQFTFSCALFIAAKSRLNDDLKRAAL